LRQIATTAVAILTSLTSLTSLAGLAGTAGGSWTADATATSPSTCDAPRFTHAQAWTLLRAAKARLTATNTAYQPSAFPSITDHAGIWRTVTAKQWTSGFFPGSLWLAYQQTGRRAFKIEARSWTHALAGQATDTSTHDIGFQIMSSFGNGYTITHDQTYKSVIMRAAKSLATRYNPTIGAIRSWGARTNTHHFKVIIDNTMNLRLLFWASAHGGQRAWKHDATRHAMTTAAHFVRADGSVIQLVDFDPATGAVLRTANPQGYSADSTWSRGQAWAAYGFTTAYAQTRNKQLLTAARRTADYFIAGLPADCVPYWDFDAPDIPSAPTDTSAAAIAAAGMLQLSKLDPNADRRKGYATSSSRILSSLADNYLADKGQATLTGSVSTFGVDPSGIGTSYGDYYLLQAVHTWLKQHHPDSRDAAPSKRERPLMPAGSGAIRRYKAPGSRPEPQCFPAT
jgi:unsaturated chondroitin disaccharide hydrolase